MESSLLYALVLACEICFVVYKSILILCTAIVILYCTF